MRFTFNRVIRTQYHEVDDVMLALTESTEQRSGVLISNNSASGGPNLLVQLSHDFSESALLTIADANFRIAPGDCVEVSCSSAVAIWLSTTGAAVDAVITEVQI